jgi:hypothetical protein
MGSGILLVALASGYAVLVMSQHQQAPLDKLGRLLGAFILLVSLVGLICVAVCAVRCYISPMGKSQCAWYPAKSPGMLGMTEAAAPGGSPVNAPVTGNQ